MIGEAYVGVPGIRLLPIEIPFLSAAALRWAALFKQDIVF